ncbi:hypothetical protein OUZ56_020766 [Daphnia magna]|uniref:Uncharacterized protein n=1 Tax=Daphnia magna TaxID=35525 RepID=A0ABQ9ZFE2_9CRUS|nr:hypothetical protein OUZ56_020766 [Daphnia magna]
MYIFCRCRWLKLFNIHHFYLASFLGIALASLIFGSLAGRMSNTLGRNQNFQQLLIASFMRSLESFLTWLY